MRKLTCFIAASLDGYIARKDDTFDWLYTNGDYGYKAYISNIDTIITGRKTWDAVTKSMPGPHYPDHQIYIITHNTSPSPAHTPSNAQYTSEAFPPFIRSLLAKPGKDIWLLGGGELVKTCLEEDLLDELIISIHPITLGEGIPLFRECNKQVKWKVVETHAYNSGLVQIRYVREKEAGEL
ncbi:Dihydrofolate reductase 2 [Rhizophlyctis rosea]|nr:Dihydrofolate reductase 2 [Rhizophlyctis rosea]